MFNIGLTALYIHCDGFHFFYITFFHPDGLKCSGATLVYSIFQNVCIERFYVSCVDVYMINSVLLVFQFSSQTLQNCVASSGIVEDKVVCFKWINGLTANIMSVCC